MSYAIYPSLKGRPVVITGGGSGIGAEMVGAFARQGARVHFIDVSESDARQVQGALAAEGLHACFRQCDLRDLDAVGTVFAGIVDDAGPIEVLVNNAGNDDRHQVDAVTPCYWDDRIAVNLRHQFFCAQLVAASMRTIGRGVILNMGSASWHVAVPNLSVYMTAKAVLKGSRADWRATWVAMAYGSTASCLAPCGPPARRNSGRHLRAKRSCSRANAFLSASNRSTWRAWRCSSPRTTQRAAQGASISSMRGTSAHEHDPTCLHMAAERRAWGRAALA